MSALTSTTTTYVTYKAPSNLSKFSSDLYRSSNVTGNLNNGERQSKPGVFEPIYTQHSRGERISKLQEFYCTKCGSYHDAITLCGTFKFDPINVSSSKNNHKIDLENFNAKCEVKTPTHIDPKPTEADLADKFPCKTPDTEVENADVSRCKSVSFNTRPSTQGDKYNLTYYQKSQHSFVISAAKLVESSITPTEKPMDSNTGVSNTECPRSPENTAVDNENDFTEKPRDLNQLSYRETKISEMQNIVTETFQESFMTFPFCDNDGRLHAAGNPIIKPNPKRYFEPDVPRFSPNEELALLGNKSLPAPCTKFSLALKKKMINTVYPLNLTHRKCVGPVKSIPYWKGWAWEHLQSEMQNDGWRPGAVACKIAKLIKKHRGGEKAALKAKRKAKRKKKEDDEDIRPMLEVVKRQGCYLITMNPVNNPYIDSDDEEAQNKPCAPINFVVDPRKEIVKTVPTCDCACDCDTSSSCRKSDGEDSTSESEFEFQFTPPICLVDREQVRKKRNLSEIGTQFDPKIGKKGKKKQGKKGKGKKDKGKKGKGKK